MLKPYTATLLIALSTVAAAELPVTGSLMDTVAAEYGEPADKTLPIGQPPITRWIYDNFTVVFENDHVITAFPRIASVENRPLTAIPERPDFVSLLDQSRNRPEAAAPEPDAAEPAAEAQPAEEQQKPDPAKAAAQQALQMAQPK